MVYSCGMSNPTLYSEAYRIAEQAHAGVSDDYIMELCDDAARQFNTTTKHVYRTSQAIYEREFE